VNSVRSELGGGMLVAIADGDAGRPIQQQVGQPRRITVGSCWNREVVDEIDGFSSMSSSRLSVVSALQAVDSVYRIARWVVSDEAGSCT